jgi:predicted site-specific integrase-resolvase
VTQQGDLMGWLTVCEAARLAGVTPQAVYGWIDRGRLCPRLTEGEYRVDADDLFRLLAAKRAATVAGVGLGTMLRWVEGGRNNGVVRKRSPGSRYRGAPAGRN